MNSDGTSAGGTASLADASAGRRGSRAESKVRQILDAAHSLFLEQPYDAVSTDAIAKAAKVSKATVYAHFVSKEELFARLVHEQCGAITSEVWQETSDDEDVEIVLRRIARNFSIMFATGKALALYRIIIAEVPRFPELGRAFFEAGPKVLHDRIEAFLLGASDRGELSVTDGKLAASQFVALISCDIPMTGMLGLEPLSRPEIERLVDSGVRLFMTAYGPPEVAGGTAQT